MGHGPFCARAAPPGRREQAGSAAPEAEDGVLTWRAGLARHHRDLAERATLLRHGEDALAELLTALADRRKPLEQQRARLYELALGWLEKSDAHWLARRAFRRDADVDRIIRISVEATAISVARIFTERRRVRGL